jgi:hypothetical protein
VPNIGQKSTEFHRFTTQCSHFIVLEKVQDGSRNKRDTRLERGDPWSIKSARPSCHRLCRKDQQENSNKARNRELTSSLAGTTLSRRLGSGRRRFRRRRSRGLREDVAGAFGDDVAEGLDAGAGAGAFDADGVAAEERDDEPSATAMPGLRTRRRMLNMGRDGPGSVTFGSGLTTTTGTVSRARFRLAARLLTFARKRLPAETFSRQF